MSDALSLDWLGWVADAVWLLPLSLLVTAGLLYRLELRRAERWRRR